MSVTHIIHTYADIYSENPPPTHNKVTKVKLGKEIDSKYKNNVNIT